MGTRLSTAALSAAVAAGTTLLLASALAIAQGTGYFSFLQLGSAFSTAPNTNTVATVNGALAFKAVDAGPTWGEPSKCGVAYRVTQEPIDPALVMRCNAYIFESTAPEWMAMISQQGLLIAGAWPPSPMYPQYPLDVRGELRAFGYQRVWAADNGDASVCFFTRQGAARWCMGMTPSLTASGEDFVISKYRDGKWVAVVRQAY